jgi:plastocyanin
VYLAWYDPEDGDLRFGSYGEIAELKIAAPSPAPSPEVAQGPADCGEDGELILEVIAQGIAFDTDCLVAPAGEAFTITFDNQDQGLPHNVAIYTDSSAAQSLFVGETFPGVAERTYDLEPQEAGDYFFRCDVHPDQMTGAFAVVDGGGAGGNGGGGGGNGGGGGGG